ncbi:hypothetical protein [Tahibacter caeni]|uniref:hypothetical protein n=1 Tax=Tahibacter caeni TaxID=1453545 RepID=UPI002147AF89|nr:hypothetical protein [Tahibacter caeni]
MRATPKVSAAFVALALLSGCATTGDPQQGGLFGWSESKARERQHELTHRDMAARDRIADEQARGDALRERHDDLDAQARQLQQELERLRQENRDLDARLRALMRLRRLDDGERRRLQALLAGNGEWLATQAATPAPSDGDVASRRIAVDRANRRNGQLQREVVALLQN